MKDTFGKQRGVIPPSFLPKQKKKNYNFIVNTVEFFIDNMENLIKYKTLLKYIEAKGINLLFPNGNNLNEKELFIDISSAIINGYYTTAQETYIGVKIKILIKSRGPLIIYQNVMTEESRHNISNFDKNIINKILKYGTRETRRVKKREI